MKRYFEITAKTKTRIGFYNALPPNPISFAVLQWNIKEGDVIPAEIRDPVTRMSRGIVKIESEKGEMGIEPVGAEIGARLVKILLPVGWSSDSVDLRAGPLRLAEIEVTGMAGDAVDEAPASIAEALGRRNDEGAAQTLDAIKTPQAFAEGLAADLARLRVRASPYARKLAKAHGIDLEAIHGTGIGGKIDARDVEAVISRSGFPGRIIKPSRRHRVMAAHLARVCQTMPLAGFDIELEVKPLLDFRKEMQKWFKDFYGLPLRIDHFLIAGCAKLLSLPEFSILNAYWHEDKSGPEIRIYPSINIGFSVMILPQTTGNEFSELTVPSIKNAGIMRFSDIARETERLIEATRSGSLSPGDATGTTFTINNVGVPLEWHGRKMPGVRRPLSIPVPETAAILSCGSIRDHSILGLSLRFDHRVCNGYEPQLFAGALANMLAQPVSIAL